MGVKGLSPFLYNREEAFFDTVRLKDCKVVVDGNVLRYRLYECCPDINSCFGGDYDKYARYIKKFFQLLLDNNIVPTVVFDGGHAKDNKKLTTTVSRLNAMTRQSVDCNAENQGENKVFPIFIGEVFQEVLTELGIKMLQSSDAAAEVIAQLGITDNCPVISNNSDFFIFNVRYFPFDLIHLDDAGMGLMSREFNRDKLMSQYGIENIQLLHLAAVFLGNDFSSDQVFHRVYMQDQGDAVNVVISMRYKTQLCQSDENSCIDGRWCFNAHSRGELKDPGVPFRSWTYKREICRTWQRSNYCRRGETCDFGHGEGELKTSLSRVEASCNTTECKEWTETGHCVNKRACIFVHKGSDRRKGVRQYKYKLCQHWEAKGRCTFGDRCYFAHGAKELGSEVLHNGPAGSDPVNVADLRIENLLLYLSRQQTIKDALSRVLVFFNKEERADIEQMVCHSSSFYEQHGDSNVVSRDLTTSEGSSLPTWFSAEHHSSHLPSWLFEMAATRTNILPFQVEARSQPSCHLAALPLHQLLADLLISPDCHPGQVEVYARVDNIITLIDPIVPRPNMEMPLASLRKVPSRKREAVLRSLLCPEVPMELLDTVPEELRLLAMVLAMWSRHGQVPESCLSAVVLCHLVLAAEDRTGREDMEQDQREAEVTLSSFYRLKETLKTSAVEFEPVIVHSLSCLQAILHATLALNKLLGSVFSFPKISQFFNGTFVYNVTVEMSQGAFESCGLGQDMEGIFLDTLAVIQQIVNT